MISNLALVSLHFVSHRTFLSIDFIFQQLCAIHNYIYHICICLYTFLQQFKIDNNTLGITNINVNVDNNIYNNCNYNNNSISSYNSIHSLFLCLLHSSFVPSLHFASISFRYVSIPFRLNKCIWKYFNNRFSFKFHVSYIVFIFYLLVFQ